MSHQLAAAEPQSIVDFGAGGGKNGYLAREVLGRKARLIAVEGCEGNTQKLREDGIYDEVHGCLLQDWLRQDSNSYDLAIFGDVLEHLTPKDIHWVIGQCMKRFRHIIVVIPLYDIFQDAVYENPLEVHRAYVTESFFNSYPVTEKHIVEGVDYVIMNVLIVTSDQRRTPPYRRAAKSLFHVAMLILQPLGLARPTVDFIKRHFLRYKGILR